MVQRDQPYSASNPLSNLAQQRAAVVSKPVGTGRSRYEQAVGSPVYVVRDATHYLHSSSAVPTESLHYGQLDK